MEIIFPWDFFSWRAPYGSELAGRLCALPSSYVLPAMKGKGKDGTLLTEINLANLYNVFPATDDAHAHCTSRAYGERGMHIN